MSKLIRRSIQKRGTALIVALQLTFVTLLSLVSFMGGPQQSAPPKNGVAMANNAPASAQVSAGQQASSASAGAQSAQPLSADDTADLRASAVYANKVHGARAS